MIKYSVAMGVRVLCIIAILFVPGYWAIIPAIGAVFLPYFAVVIANVGADPRQAAVQRPGNILPMTPPAYTPDAGAEGATDADAHTGADADAGADPDDDEEEGEQREHGT